jgi:hypothetical protein
MKRYEYGCGDYVELTAAAAVLEVGREEASPSEKMFGYYYKTCLC